MEISIYTGGFAATNGYLIQTEETCILFDAPSGVKEWLDKQGVKISHLILTHQHWDHCDDASKFENVEIYAYADQSEDFVMQKLARENWGIPLDVKPFQVTKHIKHGETFAIGDTEFKALHVPGHSPDSLAFFCQDEEMCIVGDALFEGGIGRTDFPNGDHKQLLDSIKKHLYTLPKSTTIFPGHGPDTTIETEVKNNPFTK